MLRTGVTRKTVTALAVAVAAALALPTTASAQPAPPAAELPPLFLPAPDQPTPDYAQVSALAAFVPAIMGAAAGPAEAAPFSQLALLAQARVLLANADLSEEMKSTLEAVITFMDGSGGGGPDMPPTDGPVIAQFLYPTLGTGCIADEADSVGTALAVPGPATLPPPGPPAGHAGFVFTALGTDPLAQAQAAPLTVTWLNLDNRRSGTADFHGAAGINPDGPATLSTIADTGHGRVLAVVSGSITTQSKEDPTAPARSCDFLPTIGTVVVP